MCLLYSSFFYNKDLNMYLLWCLEFVVGVVINLIFEFLYVFNYLNIYFNWCLFNRVYDSRIYYFVFLLSILKLIILLSLEGI